MLKHKITIIIEDADNGQIVIRVESDPVPTEQTVLTPALACAADLLGYVQSRTEAPAQPGTVEASSAPVEDTEGALVGTVTPATEQKEGA